MSKYELRYRVIENSSYNDFNNEMRYTLVSVDYDPKTDLIRQRGFSGWGKHGCDLFHNRKSAEKWLCELNYNHFLNQDKALRKQLADLQAENERLEAELTLAKNTNINANKMEVLQKKIEISEMEKELDDFKFGADIATNRIAELEKQLEESFSQEDVEGLIKDRKITIKNLQQILAEKDNEISRLKQYIDDHKPKTPKISNVIIRNLRVDVAELKLELEQKDKEIARLKKELENEVADSFDMEGKARTAWDELEEKDKEIENLKAKLEKCCNSQWYIDMDRLKANEAIQKLLKEQRRQVCEEIKKEIQSYLRKSGLLKLELVFGINFIIDQIEKGGTDDN